MKKEHLDRQFYKTVLTIAIPVVLQNLISIGLNMADTIMIGKLGVDELAAVGTANRLYFVFSSLCFGIYSGASVYVSQYWGVKDIKNIRRTLGIDIILGGGMALLFTAIAPQRAAGAGTVQLRPAGHRAGNRISAHCCHFLFLYLDVLCHQL